MKKLFTLLTLALLSIGSAWAQTTIGLVQEISGTEMAAATYSNGSLEHLIVAEAHGAGCGINQASKATGADDTSITAKKTFRKTVNSSTWNDTEWIGYTVEVESGYKVSLTNVKATLWDASSNCTFTWRVMIENPSGTALYTSDTKTSKKGEVGVVDVASPEGVVNLPAGKYTVKLQMYQAGGNKYFTVPYLTVDAKVETDNTPTYVVTTSAIPAEGGTVQPETGNQAEGSDVVLTATPNVGYKFVKWTVDGVDYTENPYTISNISAAHTAVATFEALYKVTYNLGEYAGTVTKVLNNASFGEVYADNDGKYTIPSYAHRYLYREGYVLSGWQDQDEKTYTTGQEITLTKDITLTPTWTATTASLKNSKGLSVVSWNFRFSQILFNAWQGNGAVGYYTKPQSVNGETIAVPMIVDATNGKVDNSGRASNDNAQVNQGSKMTIPAVPGMKIEIANANTDFSTTTIAGSTDYEGTGTKSISYVYEGSDATIDIVINENNQYLKTIVVTYPVTAANVTITPANEYTTYVTPAALDFTGLDLKAYVASESTETTVTLAEVTTVPAGTALVLKKGSAASYDVPVIASASAPAKNLLKGSATGSYTVANDGDAYVLSNGAFHPVNAGKLAAGKAYILKADVLTNAPLLNIAFGGETTGIADVRSKMEDVRDDFFDLQGRKVAQPTKGLYIVNGKKVVIK